MEKSLVIWGIFINFARNIGHQALFDDKRVQCLYIFGKKIH